MAVLKYRYSFDLSVRGRLGGRLAIFDGEGRPNIAKRFFGERTILWGRKKSSGPSRGSSKGSLGEFLRIKTPSPEPLLKRSPGILESNFPGGEATRVKTPPPLLPDDSDTDSDGLTRQPTLPGDIHSDDCRNYGRRRPHPSRRRGGPRMTSLFGWLAPSCPKGSPAARAKPRHTRTPSDTMGRGGRKRRLGHLFQRRSARELRMLVVDTAIPEHGPDSTLCPRHPEYVAGGKGVCLYHGGRNHVR